MYSSTVVREVPEQCEPHLDVGNQEHYPNLEEDFFESWNINQHNSFAPLNCKICYNNIIAMDLIM